MAYTPTNWVNGETPINAENLNNIEQGLVDLDGKCGSFRYEVQTLTSVKSSYESLDKNGLKHKGANLRAATFPDSVFLIVLSSKQSVGLGSMYLAMLGTSDTALVRLSRDASGNYPQVAVSSSGYLYVRWSESLTADIVAHMIRLK